MTNNYFVEKEKHFHKYRCNKPLVTLFSADEAVLISTVINLHVLFIVNEHSGMRLRQLETINSTSGLSQISRPAKLARNSANRKTYTWYIMPMETYRLCLWYQYGQRKTAQNAVSHSACKERSVTPSHFVIQRHVPRVTRQPLSNNPRIYGSVDPYRQVVSWKR